MKRLAYINASTQICIFLGKDLPRNFKAVTTSATKHKICMEQVKLVWYLDEDGLIYETASMWVQPFKAGIKSLRATLPDKNFLLGILLLEPCISLIYA
jgi:hypothetical protein